MRRAILGALTIVLAGCHSSEESALVRKAAAQVTYPQESRVQYAAVSTGTVYAPGANMGSTNVVSFPEAGVVLFIDEKPRHDWEHPFQLIFVAKSSGEVTTLFRGSAFPDFSFKQPDGSRVTDWKSR